MNTKRFLIPLSLVLFVLVAILLITYRNSLNNGSAGLNIGQPTFAKLMASDYAAVKFDASAESLIRRYFSLINQENYSAAYKINSQGMTAKEFEDFYKPLTDVRYVNRKKSSNSRFEIQLITREASNVNFYKVNFDIKNETINNYKSSKYDTKVYLECDSSLFKEEVCFVRNYDSGDLLFIEYYSNSSVPALGKSLKNENLQYLNSHNVSTNTTKEDIYAFYEKTFAIKIIDTLTFNSSATALKLNVTSDCSLDRIPSYNDDGCLSQYQNENWFKANLNYLQKVNLYIPDASK